MKKMTTALALTLSMVLPATGTSQSRQVSFSAGVDPFGLGVGASYSSVDDYSAYGSSVYFDDLEYDDPCWEAYLYDWLTYECRRVSRGYGYRSYYSPYHYGRYGPTYSAYSFNPFWYDPFFYDPFFYRPFRSSFYFRFGWSRPYYHWGYPRYGFGFGYGYGFGYGFGYSGRHYPGRTFVVVSPRRHNGGVTVVRRGSVLASGGPGFKESPMRRSSTGAALTASSPTRTVGSATDRAGLTRSANRSTSPRVSPSRTSRSRSGVTSTPSRGGGGAARARPVSRRPSDRLTAQAGNARVNPSRATRPTLTRRGQESPSTRSSRPSTRSNSSERINPLSRTPVTRSRAVTSRSSNRPSTRSSAPSTTTRPSTRSSPTRSGAVRQPSSSSGRSLGAPRSSRTRSSRPSVTRRPSGASSRMAPSRGGSRVRTPARSAPSRARAPSRRGGVRSAPSRSRGGSSGVRRSGGSRRSGSVRRGGGD